MRTLPTPLFNVVSTAMLLVEMIHFSLLLRNKRCTSFFLGIFNVSLIVTYSYGRSSTSMNLYKLSATGQLYTFQTYPGKSPSVVNALLSTLSLYSYFEYFTE